MEFRVVFFPSKCLRGSESQARREHSAGPAVRPPPGPVRKEGGEHLSLVEGQGPTASGRAWSLPTHSRFKSLQPSREAGPRGQSEEGQCPGPSPGAPGLLPSTSVALWPVFLSGCCFSIGSCLPCPGSKGLGIAGSGNP